ncbi:MAG: glycosyltransferase family 87 protein [Terriglobales bacterium]
MANQSFSRYLVLLCLLIASAEFVVRGPLRVIRLGDFTDYSGMYVASRRWIARADPYRSSQFKSTWLAAGGPDFQGNRGSEANLRPAYPPSSLPVLAPFALFRWVTARDLFLLSALALFPLLLWSALRLEGMPWRSNTGLLACAFALALAPWHAAIASQSISAQAIELAMIGASLRSGAGGGVATGLAFCLKPQLAAWFLLFEIAKRRWVRVFLACAVFGFITLFALVRMPGGWLDSYRENLRYFFAIGGVNDFTLRNPVRFELLNPQVLFYYLSENYRVANFLAWSLTALLVFLWFRRNWRSESAQLATIVLIGLLPVYQRIYNAGVIVAILPYAISRQAEWRGKILIAACGVFLIPGTAILQTLYRKHWIGEAVWNRSWWFNLVIGPHATWAILAIVAILLFWREKAAACERADGRVG